MIKTKVNDVQQQFPISVDELPLLAVHSARRDVVLLTENDEETASVMTLEPGKRTTWGVGHSGWVKLEDMSANYIRLVGGITMRNGGA